MCLRQKLLLSDVKTRPLHSFMESVNLQVGVCIRNPKSTFLKIIACPGAITLLQTPEIIKAAFMTEALPLTQNNTWFVKKSTGLVIGCETGKRSRISKSFVSRSPRITRTWKATYSSKEHVKRHVKAPTT